MSRAAFVTIVTVALAMRLLLIATSFGTTDALLFMIWTHLAEREGIAGAYHLVPYLNHPPLSMAMAIGADRLGRRIGLEFSDIFRLIQVAADTATAGFVYALARRFEPQRAREITAFFFASPAAIVLSGFHCNSDPTMIALLVAAIWAASRSATLSGGLLGASAGIKIVPLPLSPFFLIDMSWRRRIAFAASAAAVLAITFIPAVKQGGATVLRNIFAYGGSGYQWGFCGIGYLTAYSIRAIGEKGVAWMLLYSRVGRYVVLLALAALFVFFCRWRASLPVMIAAVLLAMNFFSPGFGVQYLVWPLPFLRFALPRRPAYTLNVALSIFLFATYTIWAHEFPWWFADATAENRLRPLVAFLALPLWLLYGWAIIVVLRATRSTSQPL